jgi:hypothetical protein
MQRNEENKRKNEKKEGCKAKGEEDLPWYEMLEKNYPTKTKKKYIDTKTVPFKERRKLTKTENKINKKKEDKKFDKKNPSKTKEKETTRPKLLKYKMV